MDFIPNLRRPWGRHTVDLEDHFLTGRSSQGGQIGSLGWGYGGTGGSVAVVNSEPGHAGILRLQSGAGADNFVNVTPQYDWYTFYSEHLSVGFWVRANHNDANTIIKLGCFGVTPWSVAVLSWCGIEKGAGDTTWQLTASLAGVETSSDSGISVGTDWVYLESEIRDGAAYFAIDGVRFPGISTHVPEGLVGIPFAQIANNAAANKTLDLDYAHIHQDLR